MILIKLTFTNGDNEGKLIFVKSLEPNEFWSALLEKAYAKHYGSYQALEGGNGAWALEAFTGGCVETFPLEKEKNCDRIFRHISKAIEKSCLLTADCFEKCKCYSEMLSESGIENGKFNEVRTHSWDQNHQIIW